MKTKKTQPNHVRHVCQAVPGGRATRPFRAFGLALAAAVVAMAGSAQGQSIRAESVRMAVPVGVSGQFVNPIIVDAVDATNGLSLSVEAPFPTGVVNAQLVGTTSFTGTTGVVNLVVDYNTSVPQTGTNEVAVLSTGDLNYRLAVPINSAKVWQGNAAANAWTTASHWQVSGVPASTDNVLFTGAGAEDNDVTNDFTSVLVAADAEVAGIRFNHGDSAAEAKYRVEIQSGATLSATGVDGFAMLKDTLPDVTNPDIPMSVEMIGGGNLVVDNSSGNLTMIAESGTGNSAKKPTLDLSGLATFTANVDRVSLGSFELYPYWGDNGYPTEPDQFVPQVTLAESNFITAAWVGGADLVTNSEVRPYAFTVCKMPGGSGYSSGTAYTMALGRTNVFFVESILFGGSGAKSPNNTIGNVFFDPDIPEGVVPTAYFRGPTGTGRVSVFAVGDNSGEGDSGQTSKSVVNLQEGKVDAMIDLLCIARDREQSRDDADAEARLFIGGTNAAGTVLDVNTAYIGMQQQGANASPTPKGGVVDAIMNVGENALLKVNTTLYIGYSTDPNAAKTAPPAPGTRGINEGTLNIDGGSVWANEIVVGGGTTNDNQLATITIRNGGELIVTNSVGSADLGLQTLEMSDSTLTLSVDGNNTDPYVYVVGEGGEVGLVTEGSKNTIKLASAVNVSFGTPIDLIQYAGDASPNFVPELPSGVYGYIVNDTVAKMIQVVLLDTPPNDLLWTGSAGSNWDTLTTSWTDKAAPGPSLAFVNGDQVTFDDSASSGTVNVVNDVFIGGDGVLVTNDTLSYTIGGQGIKGTAPMHKWGSSPLTINAKSELSLTVHEGNINGTSTTASIGSTTLATNTSLTFAGKIARLTSAGTSVVLNPGAEVANTVTMQQGTLSNSGTINSTVVLQNDAVMTHQAAGVVSMNAPGTSRVGPDATLELTGDWHLTTFGTDPGNYLLEVDGLMYGTGKFFANPTDSEKLFPAARPRVNIAAGGVFSPGAFPGDIIVHTNEGRFDFQVGARVILDVDMTGLNAFAGDPTSIPGGNIWQNARRSDVMQVQRWSTMQGTLVLNNISAQPFTNGTVLKLFKKKNDERWPWANDAVRGLYRNHPDNADQLPVIEPAIPGLGLQWDLSMFRTNGLITVVAGGPTEPPGFDFQLSGDSLSMSWPTNYLGWQVYAQTNDVSVGLSTNWVAVPGTTAATTFEVTIDTNNPAVLYSLGLPQANP